MVALCRPKLISGRFDDDDEVVPVDACIAPLVQSLNDHSVRTFGSCCGHGKEPGFISFEDAEGFVRYISLEKCEIAPAGDTGTEQSRGALMEDCGHDDRMTSIDFTEEDSRAWERANRDAVESDTGGDDAL